VQGNHAPVHQFDDTRPQQNNWNIFQQRTASHTLQQQQHYAFDHPIESPFAHADILHTGSNAGRQGAVPDSAAHFDLHSSNESWCAEAGFSLRPSHVERVSPSPAAPDMHGNASDPSGSCKLRQMSWIPSTMPHGLEDRYAQNPTRPPLPSHRLEQAQRQHAEDPRALPHVDSSGSQHSSATYQSAFDQSMIPSIHSSSSGESALTNISETMVAVSPVLATTQCKQTEPWLIRDMDSLRVEGGTDLSKDQTQMAVRTKRETTWRARSLPASRGRMPPNQPSLLDLAPVAAPQPEPLPFEAADMLDLDEALARHPAAILVGAGFINPEGLVAHIHADVPAGDVNAMEVMHLMLQDPALREVGNFWQYQGHGAQGAQGAQAGQGAQEGHGAQERGPFDEIRVNAGSLLISVPHYDPSKEAHSTAMRCALQRLQQRWPRSVFTLQTRSTLWRACGTGLSPQPVPTPWRCTPVVTAMTVALTARHGRCVLVEGKWLGGDPLRRQTAGTDVSKLGSKGTLPLTLHCLTPGRLLSEELPLLWESTQGDRALYGCWKLRRQPAAHLPGSTAASGDTSRDDGVTLRLGRGPAFATDVTVRSSWLHPDAAGDKIAREIQSRLTTRSVP